MRNEVQFRLSPTDPTTDTQLVVVSDGQATSQMMNIQSWRRVPPHHKSPTVVNCRDGMCYQCTPLDHGCCIEAKWRSGGAIKHQVLLSNPVMLSSEIRQRALYVIENIPCRLVIDEFHTMVSLNVEHRRIKLSHDICTCQLPLLDSVVQVEPSQPSFRFNFLHVKVELLRFFGECLRWSPKVRAQSCLFYFNSKFERDLSLYLVAEQLNSSNSSSMVFPSSMTPRNGQRSPLSKQNIIMNSNKILKKNESSSSLTSNNTKKQKNKDKIKISERLNLKRSYTKFSSNKILQADKSKQSGECLNVFEDDDNAEITSGGVPDLSTGGNDTAMDLRGSFEELEQKSISKLDDEKTSNHSFRHIVKNDNAFQVQNRNLKQQNMKLKKTIESMTQAIRETTVLKKKYQSAVEEISRLESERRAIITDKVKYESIYHREVQEKQYFKKELEKLRQALSPKPYGRY